jgi:hypothetical protein
MVNYLSKNILFFRKLKLIHCIIILILLILIFFSLRSLLFKNSYVWQLSELSYEDANFGPYHNSLKQYNEIIFKYNENKEQLFFYEYKNYYNFEDKFKDHNKLNDYLVKYNNLFKKNLKILKKDINFLQVKNGIFQLRYYGNDLISFSQFIEFMIESIKNEIIIDAIKKQNELTKNLNSLINKQSIIKLISKDELFYQNIYLSNLKFQQENDNYLILDELINKNTIECIYYLGFQHEHSEIPNKIKFFLEEKDNYILNDFYECKYTMAKKETEKFNLELYNNFLNTIYIINDSSINKKISENDKSVYIKKIFQLLFIFILILFLFFYKNNIYLFFIKIIK